MKLAILSRNPEIYSTSRLVAAALKRGHDVHVVNHLHCYMNIGPDAPSIGQSGTDLTGFDAVLPRIGVSATFYGTAVVRQFESMGTYAVNGSMAITMSRDKLRSLQLLSRAGVALPVTGFAHSTHSIDELIDMVGGAPLIVKLLKGTQGKGVILAETRKAAESTIEAFRHLRTRFLVQEYFAECKGSDLRCFVVGGHVIAAIVRQGLPDEYRSNLHRGGLATLAILSPEERSLALRAVAAVGLNVAGVDILRTNRGPVVIEVNSSPGLQGIEKVTGLDVAGCIVEHIEEKVGDARFAREVVS
ncbi:MAG: 30S ribosomal protein S6--L-glutamate ligase [Bacteroidetes bacterium]|nr:30S ribosomal protein S6--L-glutamate ligase [Bacteroidota bacterium]